MERQSDRNQESEKGGRMSQTKDQDEIAMLRSENAYLRGQISAYERYLRKMGIIVDAEEEKK